LKIELEIPEWAKDHNIYVFAGKELFAYCFRSDDKRELLVKNGRCNGCGYCCENLGPPYPQKMIAQLQFILEDYKFEDTGRCPFLLEDGCMFKGDIPFGCAQSDCSRFPGCTESFKVEGT
jgi:hypothetical protein